MVVVESALDVLGVKHGVPGRHPATVTLNRAGGVGDRRGGRLDPVEVEALDGGGGRARVVQQIDDEQVAGLVSGVGGVHRGSPWVVSVCLWLKCIGSVGGCQHGITC